MSMSSSLDSWGLREGGDKSSVCHALMYNSNVRGEEIVRLSSLDERQKAL